MFDQDQQRDYAEEEYNRRLMREESEEECDCEDHAEYEDNWSRCAECGDPIDYCQGHADIYARCPWCQSDDAEDYSPDLCRAHLAEYEGLSVDELDRRDKEEAWDLL